MRRVVLTSVLGVFVVALGATGVLTTSTIESDARPPSSPGNEDVACWELGGGWRYFSDEGGAGVSLGADNPFEDGDGFDLPGDSPAFAATVAAREAEGWSALRFHALATGIAEEFPAPDMQYDATRASFPELFEDVDDATMAALAQEVRVLLTAMPACSPATDPGG